jgi:hypothetical protein
VIVTGGGGLVAREKQSAREKADMSWNVTRGTPASPATHCVNPRKKSETSLSGGAGREARYPAKKGSRSSAVACRNAGKERLLGERIRGLDALGQLRVAREWERHEANVDREAAQCEGEVSWGRDHRDAEFTELSQNMAEWYFQTTVHSFGDISREQTFDGIFGYRDISVLLN